MIPFIVGFILGALSVIFFWRHITAWLSKQADRFRNPPAA